MILVFHVEVTYSSCESTSSTHRITASAWMLRILRIASWDNSVKPLSSTVTVLGVPPRDDPSWPVSFNAGEDTEGDSIPVDVELDI